MRSVHHFSCDTFSCDSRGSQVHLDADAHLAGGTRHFVIGSIACSSRRYALLHRYETGCVALRPNVVTKHAARCSKALAFWRFASYTFNPPMSTGFCFWHVLRCANRAADAIH